MKRRKVLFPILLLATVFLTVQCNNDEPIDYSKGSIKLDVTDAPSDDAKVSGVFVTIADVKIDGVSVEGFEKQTIEISNYQDGDVKTILNEKLEVGTYNELSLVLDAESDVNGDYPGSYLLTNDNEKYAMDLDSESSIEISLDKEFNIDQSGETNLVVDFDLRKLIIREETAEPQGYSYNFLSSSEIKTAFRVVNTNRSGKIEGKVSGELATDTETYVFLYKRGEYSFLTETMSWGTSGILFANAVTSAKVNADGSYSLPFVEEGEYEVHLATFSQNSFGIYMYDMMLSIRDAILNEVISVISISANVDLMLNIEIVSES